MSFEQFSLDRRVMAGVKAVGFTDPTPIQEQAIPYALEGRDVLGLAQTGTGKTAAFLLPILNKLASGQLGQVRALIVAPTRELAEQILEASQGLSQRTRVRTIAVYGGVNKSGQEEALWRGAEIVVACPGRLLDLLRDETVDLSHVEFLVLDEADRMCDMGFLPDIKRILKFVPKRRQTMFFSATMPDDIRRLSQDILKNPKTVQIGQIAPAKTVSHVLYPIPHKRKRDLLLAMLPQLFEGRKLVFTRTKYRARDLARTLERKGYRAAALQGNMSQNRRQEAINGFHDGKYDILVATDIAARGIDVSDITHVINFDMPDTLDAYTHRIGRTGRATKEGEAFTFAHDDDKWMVNQIEKLIGNPLEKRRLPEFDYDGFDPESLFANGTSSKKKSRASGQNSSEQSSANGNGRSGSKRTSAKRKTTRKRTSASRGNKKASVTEMDDFKVDESAMSGAPKWDEFDSLIDDLQHELG